MKMDKVAGSGNDEFLNKNINNWTVLDILKIKNRIYFKCQCSCNKKTIKNVLKSNLLNNKSKSCGCLISNTIKERNKRENLFIENEYYIIGKDANNNEFLFDKYDFENIKNYYWSKNTQGYFVANINSRKIFLHRFILNVNTYELKIDHINHKVSDNRRSNLRICEHKQNLCNSTLNKNNKSGYKGIFFNKKYNKWEVSGTYNHKKYYLGRFEDINEAIKIRIKWEEEYQKEYKYKGDI